MLGIADVGHCDRSRRSTEALRRKDHAVDNFVILSLMGERGHPYQHLPRVSILHAEFQGRSAPTKVNPAFAGESNARSFHLC